MSVPPYLSVGMCVPLCVSLDHPGACAQPVIVSVTMTSHGWDACVDALVVPPALRSIPPLMWMRFRNDLGSLLISKNHGGVGVLTWNHQECRDVAMEFFVQTREIKEQIHEVCAHVTK